MDHRRNHLTGDPPNPVPGSEFGTRNRRSRILVIGTSCAGKSSFARALGLALGHPCVELDALYWGPNWKPKPLEEFRALAADAASGERWIIEGNYSDVRALIWPRADIVIWLNYGFATVMWRALRRTLRRNLTRQELWHGNRESLRRSFLSRDSILVWVATTFHKRQRQFAALRTSGAFEHLDWIEFRRPAEAADFLRSLAKT